MHKQPIESCVELVHTVRNQLVQIVDKYTSYARVVFATQRVGTNLVIVRSLYKFAAQLSTQVFYMINRFQVVFIPTFHRTNNGYYKGD